MKFFKDVDGNILGSKDGENIPNGFTEMTKSQVTALKAQNTKDRNKEAAQRALDEVEFKDAIEAGFTIEQAKYIHNLMNN